MLRVTIEIVPSGDESAKRVLEVVEIGNVSNLAAVSNYKVERTQNGHPIGLPFIVHDHRRDAGFWELVRRVADIARRK